MSMSDRNALREHYIESERQLSEAQEPKAPLELYFQVKESLEKRDEDVIGTVWSGDPNTSSDDDEEEEESPKKKKKTQLVTNNEISEALRAVRLKNMSYDSDHHPYKEFFLINGKSIENFTFKELKSIAKESAFGDLKTTKTKIDHSVRKAFEIIDGKGSQVYLTLVCLKYLKTMALQLSKSMYSGHPVKLVFNKINLYEEGCFFKKHQDTPRVGVVGTFILTLPTYFDGGVFELWTKSSSSYHVHFQHGLQLYKNQSILSTPFLDTCQSYKSLAFYPELPHEITPVTKGCRISVSFYIQTIDEIPIPWESMNKEKNDTLLNVVKKRVYDEKQSIGIFLQGHYSTSDYKKGVYVKDNNDVNLLKLFECEQKLNIDIIPVVINRKAKGASHSDDDEDDVGEEETEYVLLNKVLFDYKKDFKTFKDVPFFGDTDYVVLDIDEQNGLEWTGNESQEMYVDNFYYSFAMILSPPSHLSKK
jgi:hypothetical protein